MMRFLGIGAALLTFLGGSAAVGSTGLVGVGAATTQPHGTESGCGPHVPKSFPSDFFYNGVVAEAKKGADYHTILYSFPRNTIELWCIEHVGVALVPVGRLKGRVLINGQFWRTASKKDIQRFVNYLKNTGDYSRISVVKNPYYY